MWTLLEGNPAAAQPKYCGKTSTRYESKLCTLRVVLLPIGESQHLHHCVIHTRVIPSSRLGGRGW